MVSRAKASGILRIVGRMAAIILAIIFLLFAIVQFQQHLLRHRAERLVVDIQSIRLNQSTWSDAQSLIHRWGAWGHYEGHCDATDCDYQISLRDVVSNLFMMSPKNYDRLVLFRVPQAYRRLGGKWGGINFQFKVQDSIIVGTRTEFDVESKVEGSLIVVAQSRQSLNNAMGNNAQLAQHPNYKVGRPDGCEGCLMANISYTPQISQSEIVRFTSFDLSCLTRFRECVVLEQILPASRERHLNDNTWGEIHSTSSDSLPPLPPPSRPCETPVWALGRDATSAYVVDTISRVQDLSIAPERNEIDIVRVAETLLGQNPWSSTSLISAYPFDGWGGPPYDLPEHLVRDRRYIVLLDYKPNATQRELAMDRCGVIDDTSTNRRELQKGFALNQPLRRPDFGRFR